MDFDLYYNKVTQKYDNSYYPYHKTITCDEDFKEVVIYDCVGAKYKNNHSFTFVCLTYKNRAKK